MGYVGVNACQEGEFVMMLDHLRSQDVIQL